MSYMSGSGEESSAELDNIASVLGDMGKLEEAKKLSQDALKIYREIGDYTERRRRVCEP
jgi:hypothetical protein